MKIKCIDNSIGDGTAKAFERLVLGQIYETNLTRSDWRIGFNVRVIGMRDASFFQSRFVIVEDDACEQCGERHL